MVGSLISRASVAELMEDYQLGPLFKRQFGRIFASDYQSFVDQIESDIEGLISLIEAGASLRQADGEDRLTDELILGLNSMGYKATHDTYVNGHSDIVVSSPFNPYVWLAEAKIHSDYQWLYDGFCQLSERYSIGGYEGCRGGLIIYVKNKDAAAVVGRWSDELVARHSSETHVLISADIGGNPLRFESKHKHVKSGLDYHVRHFAVVMYFSPTK